MMLSCECGSASEGPTSLGGVFHAGHRQAWRLGQISNVQSLPTDGKAIADAARLSFRTLSWRRSDGFNRLFPKLSETPIPALVLSLLLPILDQ